MLTRKIEEKYRDDDGRWSNELCLVCCAPHCDPSIKLSVRPHKQTARPDREADTPTNHNTILPYTYTIITFSDSPSPDMDTQFAAVPTVPYWRQPANGYLCATHRTAVTLPTAEMRPGSAMLRLGRGGLELECVWETQRTR